MNGGQVISIFPLQRTVILVFHLKILFFLKINQKKTYKDTVQLDINYYGIDGVLGVVKYEGGQYVDFLNGFEHISYFFNVGNIYFGPFGETMVTY